VGEEDGEWIGVKVFNRLLKTAKRKKWNKALKPLPLPQGITFVTFTSGQAGIARQPLARVETAIKGVIQGKGG
jgi:hypothetical protein